MSPNTVPADLLYFSPPSDGSRPYNGINTDATGKYDRNWSPVNHTVHIENVRGNGDSVTLDTAGFQFYKRSASHKTFVDDAEIEREYYPESEKLIRELTGASRVVLFDHTIRRHRPGEAASDETKRQPVSQVHVDQTTASAVARVHRHLPASDVPELLKRRFQIINLWRPISHAALDWPLALCDYRSVDVKKDLAPVTLVYPDRQGETFGVKFSPEHKWKYLRGMTPDEIVLIKCFDSVDDGSVAVLTPHTAFKDPSTPEGSPLRESIELRALVFYD